ncbi:hypothetical protein CCR75_004339 [Bremia lactucae]|uniref:FYVE-type domain-containing protein n=1 Tax=Bremia lactucae TaxID=4779 RepID=A0A976FJP1_BRELC|nr:hypothetical protein CCR75_004339 [Bremia lactucae]
MAWRENYSHSTKRQEEMKFTLPKDAFSPLTLSEKRQASIATEAETVVLEAVAASERFINEGANVGHSAFKLVRARDGLRVYRQRKRSIHEREPPILLWSKESENSSCRTYHSNESSHTWSSCSGVTGDSIMERMRPRGVALLVLYGTIDGTLDDCMYGCVAPTDEAWMLRSSHIKDRLDDARILSTIQGPTCSEPFRFLGIKWFAKEIPLALRGIVQQRDFVIIESIGCTHDSTGKRVGYMLMHSVTLKEVPELAQGGIVRGMLSFCFLFRQYGVNQIQTFGCGFFDTRGDVPSRLSVSMSAESAISCVDVVAYAYIKKLLWYMKHASTHASMEGNQSRVGQCDACAKTFSKFSLTSSSTGYSCHICRQVMCSKCSVAKNLTMDVSETGAYQQCSLRFCIRCLLAAKQQSSVELAISCLKATSGSSTFVAPRKNN